MAITRSIYVSILASAFLLCGGRAVAIEIISNMPGNDGTSTFLNAPAGGSNGGGVFDSKAAGFTMPGGLPYTLDFVTLRLDFFNSDSLPMVQLYNSVNNNPGSLLQTLQNPAFTVGLGNYQFSPTSPLTLTSGETYWIVVWNNASVANSFRWMANSPSIAPTGIATNAGFRFSNGAPPPTSNSATFNSYSVNATPVPEPATMTALAVGALVVARRRRKA
jgi:hypothetical protein